MIQYEQIKCNKFLSSFLFGKGTQRKKKGGTIVIKKIFVMFGLSCFILSGCQNSAETALESSTLTPTGYASEEVQRISVFYDGSLYLYNATGFDLPKENGWEPSESQKLYVKYDNGFALFEAE